MFGPIDWRRTFEYVLVAAFYLTSLLMFAASLSEGRVAVAALSAVGSGTAAWYLLKKFGDGILIGER
jgi:hypothetical protein